MIIYHLTNIHSKIFIFNYNINYLLIKDSIETKSKESKY